MFNLLKDKKFELKINSARDYFNNKIEYYKCKQLVSSFIHSEHFCLFPASASPERHHYHVGGLLIHTYEVSKLSLASFSALKEIKNLTFKDERNLFIASLFHDVGKLYDYCLTEFDTYYQFDKTRHYTLIKHLSESNVFFRTSCVTYENDLNLEDIEDISHAILSHHGRLEWGSPIEPQTDIAYLLHCADCTSSRTNEMK